MSNHPDWLPHALKYSDFNGKWDEFLTTVYRIFERDFKQSTPTYREYPVTYDSRIQNGKEAVFWHITCRDNPRTKHRELDIRRCERIPWPRPMIEHPDDPAVSIWKNKKKRDTRVLIWLENLDYLVVMAEKTRAMILITAYCTDIKSQRQKLIKQRDEYHEMQKSPERAA